MNEYQMLKSLRKITKRWMEKLNSIPAKRIELKKDNDMKFKVGDKVKITRDACLKRWGIDKEIEGEIIRILGIMYPYEVKFKRNTEEDYEWFDEKELELLSQNLIEEALINATENERGEPQLKGEDKESYTVTATIGTSDPYETITVTASGAPRPEGEGDVFHNGKKIGTFVENEIGTLKVKFQQTFDLKYYHELVFVKTVPFNGNATLEIGNEKNFGVGGNIISGGVATEEDMLRDGKKAIERLGKYINATQDKHNPFEDYAEWLRSGGGELDWNDGCASLGKTSDDIIIWDAGFRGTMDIYYPTEKIFECTQDHECKDHNHYDYFKPIAENWYRRYMLEKLTGVKLDE